MNKLSNCLIAAIVAFSSAHMAQANDTAGPGVEFNATVTKEQASATALEKVRKGAITSAELEKEHGRMVWSFDISQPGKSGVTEVQVDARTGKVVSIAHESAAAESKEAQAERNAPVRH
jgi:uncharacterized membrane protein YkoI